MRVEKSAVTASCAIMSEGKSLNGSDVGCSSSKLAESIHSPSSDTTDGNYALGGRLKFFKDGKFILELSHKKDGEKDSWIQVPKKSYWQPGVANSTGSFSASDETSSVQLSPWQRDHCWKQSAPRRMRGAEMTFRMVPLPAALNARETHRTLLRRLRRRPHDSISTPAMSSNGCIRPSSKGKTKGSPSRLTSVVQRLWDILKTSTVFSPRKRILREMERVSIVAEEPVKRQRPRAPAAGNSKGVSSYSITSLLGPREEDSSFLRNLLRSPSPKTKRQSPPPESFPAMHPPYVYYPFQPVVPHPYYMTGSPSHSLWSPYPLSSLPRGAGGPYSGLMPPYAPSHFQFPWGAQSPECEVKREDPSADVPLNLSKHGGG